MENLTAYILRFNSNVKYEYLTLLLSFSITNKTNSTFRSQRNKPYVLVSELAKASSDDILLLLKPVS